MSKKVDKTELHHSIIIKFYTAFAEDNIDEMVGCYHEDITFEDPAFGVLHGEEVTAMWQLLNERAKTPPNITFNQVEADDDSGSANWHADYKYGPMQRPVSNRINAKFKFKDGKIIDHRDQFDLWTWSQQALGLSGYLLGWAPFFKKKMNSQTKAMVDKYLGR